MKRLIALLTSALALAACSSPVAPVQQTVRPEVAKAQSSLKSASKIPVGVTGRLSSN